MLQAKVGFANTFRYLYIIYGSKGAVFSAIELRDLWNFLFVRSTKLLEEDNRKGGRSIWQTEERKLFQI